jgi:preprotein translocase subunit SecF
MLRILHDTNVDFIRRWKIALITLAVFLVPAIVMIAIANFDYSIEFTGGTQVQVKFNQAPNISQVRSVLAQAGLPGAEIATFGRSDELMVRAQDPRSIAQQGREGAETVVSLVTRALEQRYGANSFSIVRTEAVSPRVGQELGRQATTALLISFVLTLIYLAWRFEWRFGLAAVLATIHDILATVAFIKYMNLEISLFVVGAVLTVIGYSMNDTVVVFDRVRENLRSARKENFRDLLNRSVNETLPRTVMTGTTTLACLLALLIFGGEVIRPFAWVLTFGILVGTFSSIFVASPLLLWIERKWPRKTAWQTTSSTATPTSRTKRSEAIATR